MNANTGLATISKPSGCVNTRRALTTNPPSEEVGVMADPTLFEHARTVNECWRDVVGYEGLYEVSDMGGVRWHVSRPPSHKVIPGERPKTWIDDQGYVRVALRDGEDRQRIKLVHILVAAAFLGPCPLGMEVNHKDGRRKDDPSLANLEYITHADNVRHSHATGLAVILRGEQHGCAKVNELIVRIIRRCVGGLGMKQREVAEAFGLDRTTVGYINCGRLWGHIPVAPKPPAPCAICGGPVPKGRRSTCGAACRVQHLANLNRSYRTRSEERR